MCGMKNEIKVELNVKKLIDEVKEVTQAFNELVDKLELIDKKYSDKEVDKE